MGEDEVGLEIKIVPTYDDNDTSPQNVPESKNQGDEVYNAYWEHGGILRWNLMGPMNHNICVHFALDINPTNL